jgi:hypothetical protein
MTDAARRVDPIDIESMLDLDKERIHVMLSATVTFGHRAIAVRLREVSRDSARVESAIMPPIGTLVRFCRGSIDVAARVVSVGPKGFELELHETIDERALLIVIGGTRRPVLRSDDLGVPVSKH